MHRHSRLSGLRLAAAAAACVATASAPAAATDFNELAAAISQTMAAHHFDPTALQTPAYQAIEAKTAALAAEARDAAAFVDGYNALWREGPFSHVRLQQTEQTADEMAAYLDALRVGGGGATLTWEGDVAVLTVRTMMGLDTIEEIEAAYDAIAAEEARALIIDLRENDGGSFAVRPLVSHLIAAPLDAGVFVSQAWNGAHDAPPTARDADALTPWDGWSIRAFWADVQEAPLTRIQFQPTGPRFDGPVAVLISARTFSAAEFAADALKGSGRATLIGERTAGQMLSQKMYDLPGGFQLSVPIADYYSRTTGRIEGQGVTPDLDADPAEAMAVALEQLSAEQ